MSSTTERRTAISLTPPSIPRLRLQPDRSGRTLLDGGWWPRSAEAERERRARIISADGEYQASKKLAQAATVMSADAAALQLRLLQIVVEVAAEKNSTLVMPVPVELLRLLDRAAPVTGHARPAAPLSAAPDTPAIA